MQQLKKMGGLGSMMGFLPGIGKLKDQLAGAVPDDMLKQTEAIILSMTKKERQFPKLLNASRRKRIATGAGTDVQAVNKVVKQHQQMEKMMKKMKKFGQKGGMPKELEGLDPNSMSKADMMKLMKRLS